VPAALADELALYFNGHGNGLFIGDARLAHFDADVEFPDEPGGNDFQVELAHAGDDRLAGLFVKGHLEGGVFFGQFLEGFAEFILVSPGPGLDGNGDNGFGEADGFEENGFGRVAEGIAGKGIFKSEGGNDGAGVGGGNVLPVIGVHQEKAANAFRPFTGRVKHLGAYLYLTGIDSKINEPTHEGVGNNFKGQGGEGCVIAGFTDNLLAGAGVDTVNGRDFQRGGEIINHGIEEELDTHIPQGAAANNGDPFISQGYPS
jgi:hypothetical protein